MEQWKIWIPVFAALVAALVPVIIKYLAKPLPAKKRPLPPKYGALLPGSLLSTVKTAFPGKINHLSNTPYYRIILNNSETFRLARCFFDGIKSIKIFCTVLYFKDSNIAAQYKQQALSTFGSKKVISTPSDCFVWIVSGFRIKMNDKVYEIKKATVLEKLVFSFFVF